METLKEKDFIVPATVAKAAHSMRENLLEIVHFVYPSACLDKLSVYSNDLLEVAALYLHLSHHRIRNRISIWLRAALYQKTTLFVLISLRRYHGGVFFCFFFPHFYHYFDILTFRASVMPAM
jgi:hypothetical protein